MSIFGSIGKALGGVVKGAVGTVLPGVGSAIDGILGMVNSNSDAKASLRAQSQLLQKQQQFAHDEAQLNRDYQTEMWDKSNLYNSPSAQVDRLVAAGLNPALAYGGSMSEASPMSGSAASSSGAPSVDGISDRSLRAAQIANLGAQTQNIMAQTKKTEAETQTQLTYNHFQNALLGNEIQFGSVQVRLGLSQIGLTDAQKRIAYKDYEKTQMEIDVLDAKRDEIRASGMKIDSERFLNEIERRFRSKELSARIDQICEVTRCSRIQAEAAMKQACAYAAHVEFETDVENNPLLKLISIQGDTIKLDYDILTEQYGGKSFRYWQIVNDAVKDYFKVAADLVGSYFSSKKSPAPAPKVFVDNHMK